MGGPRGDAGSTSWASGSSCLHASRAGGCSASPVPVCVPRQQPLQVVCAEKSTSQGVVKRGESWGASGKLHRREAGWAAQLNSGITAWENSLCSR